MNTRTVCMVAYANYFTDARIKNYVEALIQAGCRVDVFALGQTEPVRPGLRVFCLMSKVESGSMLPYVFQQLWFFAVAMYRVTVAFLQQHYFAIHVHNMPDFIVFVALIPKLLGARVILDIHDTMPEAYATKFHLPLSHLIIGLLWFEERLSAAFADQVITTNDLHKEALVGHGIPSNKITIVMNVGNKELFHPRPLPVSCNGLTLAYHGTIAERLGLDLILDAIRQARPMCPGLRFILIGGGEFMPVVRQLIQKYDLEEIVQITDWVTVECLPDYLSTADVGVVGNRRYTETHQNWMLPVKMLEYAAMEIPTIAPRLRAIEYYFDESNSVLYEPDNSSDLARCIREVYAHRGLIEQLKKGLREFNLRNNWEDMGKRYIGLLGSLAEDWQT